MYESCIRLSVCRTLAAIAMVMFTIQPVQLSESMPLAHQAFSPVRRSLRLGKLFHQISDERCVLRRARGGLPHLLPPDGFCK